MSKIGLGQKLRYRFDNFMSRGGSSIFISLVIVFISLLTVISIIRGVLLFTLPEAALERGPGFWNNVYITFLQMTDPGNMNQDVNSIGWFKIPAIISGMAGLIMLSSLVAFITTALDQKLAQLRKGHSKVIEEDHTLILGWNERVIEILRELLEANESEDNPVVVILADKDKEEMDDFLKVNMPNTRNTRVVTRSGSPSSLVKLETASVTASRSVIVLANCSVTATQCEKNGSDANVIKTALALVASRPEDLRLNIVAEIFADRNRKIIEGISEEEITTVDTNEILAKILVQTSRSVGLSVVYSEILSFDGCEMYFHEDDWGDIAFGQLGYRFPDGIPMGLKHGDGTLAMNPPSDLKIKPDDSILILAEDDSTIDYRDQPVAAPRDFKLAGGRKKTMVERNLIIGWTTKVETILREYAEYVKPGSFIDILLRAPEPDLAAKIEELNEELEDIRIRLVAENPMSTEGLMAVDPSSYDNIIILSQGGAEDGPERTDSETIVILLLLRKIMESNPREEGRSPTKLITEILESENQSLVAHAGVNDFIISNRFISMLVAQISEDADIKPVYDDLFQEDGSEIYLKPAPLYFSELPIEVTYADMIHVCQQREEVCLGVKLKALEDDMSQNLGVKLIPEKNKVYRLNAEDTLVVLAEDET